MPADGRPGTPPDAGGEVWNHILTRRILFVGGKGGVGKTTTAAAVALRLAEAGRRCLLVSTDPAHSLGDLFDRRIGEKETTIVPNLTALEVDPEAESDRHLEGVKRTMRSLVKPALYHEIDRQMELTRQAPGAVEAALLERVASLMDEAGQRFDHLLFDTAPTGHTLRLLSLPEIMAAWTDGLLKQRDRSDALGRAVERAAPAPGQDLTFLDPAPHNDDPRSARIRETLMERRRLFSRARRLLLDRDVTGFLLVLIPEKLPILESRMALEALRSFDVPVLGVVVNRVLPPEPLGEFLEARRGQEAAYLERIRKEFAGLPAVHLPFRARDVEGLEGLRALAAEFG